MPDIKMRIHRFRMLHIFMILGLTFSRKGEGREGEERKTEQQMRIILSHESLNRDARSVTVNKRLITID